MRLARIRPAPMVACSSVSLVPDRSAKKYGRVTGLLTVPSGKMAVMIASRLWVRVAARHDDRGIRPAGRSPSGRPARFGGQRAGGAARSDCLGWR
jgi:hypothetical protein